MKIKNIVIGWWNWLFTTKEDWMNERKNICKTCPRNRCGFCGECGCLISAKVCVKSASCPLSKWKSLETKDDVLDDILKKWEMKN